MRQTKIICTIGPATDSAEMLEKLADAGMNVARLNMSHGDHSSHAKIIKSIHKLNKRRNHPIAILLDTQGPEIRTGDRAEDLHLQEGDTLSIVARGAEDVESSSIQINYDDLITDVNVGDTITVDNGLINLQVLSKQDRNMQVKVIDGGLLKSKRQSCRESVSICQRLPRRIAATLNLALNRALTLSPCPLSARLKIFVNCTNC